MADTDSTLETALSNLNFVAGYVHAIAHKKGSIVEVKAGELVDRNG